ncbi:MAG: alpha/beta hydrolase [Candidatus Woesearchaeota archaeon]
MEQTKTQIFYVHGGMTFKNKDDYLHFLKNRPISIDEKIKWSGNYLKEQLKNCTIIKPRMPLQDNAQYEEWKIHLERHFEYLTDNIILIGVSIGGIFLSKYLSEHIFPKQILSVYLVCPPFDDTLIGEDLAGGFELQDDLSLIEKNCKNVTLIFSKDDDCVPVNHADKYREKLPNASIIIYESKNGHFKIKEFPEIIESIKNDLKNL